MITYQRERALDLWDEILPLLKLHWQEIATFKDIPLDPDVERYNAMDEAGWLRCYTARTERLSDAEREVRHIELVGYCVVSVAANMHHRSSKIAHQDVLYVHPHHRGGQCAVGLLNFAEASLQAEGFVLLYQHSKPANPALGRMLEKRGYEAEEIIWAKRLGDRHG